VTYRNHQSNEHRLSALLLRPGDTEAIASGGGWCTLTDSRDGPAQDHRPPPSVELSISRLVVRLTASLYDEEAAMKYIDGTWERILAVTQV
jgi:hypothetical protein